jgi:hypothetical protein
MPLTLGAQPDATIHQEYRYQLPNPKLNWTPVAGLPLGLRILPESGELWGAPSEAGRFQFMLQGSDGSQLTLNLKVNALWNLSLTPPQAAAGVAFSHSQVVGGGTPPYSFTAAGLPPGLSISKGGLISGTPSKAGSYSGNVTAADSVGNQLSLPYSLTVNVVGITTTSLPPVDPNKPYSQQLSATGGVPPYTWKLPSAFPFSCGLSQHPAFPVPVVDPVLAVPFPRNSIRAFDPFSLSPDGILTVSSPVWHATVCVQVTDSTGNEAKAQLSLDSPGVSTGPLDAYLSPSSEEVSVGDAVAMTVYEDGGTFPFTETPLVLPPGFVFYSDQSLVVGYPQAPGTYAIRFQVKDGAGRSVMCESTLRVSPIRVGAAKGDTPTYRKPYSRQFYAVGAAPPYSWALVPRGQLPAGLALSSAGLLSGTPLETGDFYTLGRITDAFGNSCSFLPVAQVSAGTPEALGIFDFPTYLTLNRVSSYSIRAFGYTSNPPYTLSLTGSLPPGMVQQSIEQANAEATLHFWGVPTAAGTYSITVRATDAKGNLGVRNVAVNVTPLYGDSPISNTLSNSLFLPSAVVGLMSQTQLPVGGGTPPYRWSLTYGSPPAGMTLSSSGLLSGTPSRAGFSSFNVAITDANSNTIELSVVLDVIPFEIITPLTGIVVPPGQPFSLQLEAAGGSPGYIWTLQYPDCSLGGLTLSPGGLLSGMPTDNGNFGCYIVVSDSTGASTTAFLAFSVAEPAPIPPPRIFGPISVTGSVGAFLSTQLNIVAADPTVTAAPGSTLPPGLAINGKTLSGYPTTVGDYAFQIQVTDRIGNQAGSRAYVTVSPLHIVSFPPAGIYNQPYSYQFQVLERQQPVVWSLDPNARIPVGLSLSAGGLFSGVPKETGTFNFNVRANDAIAKVTLTIDSGASKTYSLDPLPPDSSPVGGGIFYSLYYDLAVRGQAVKFSLVDGTLPPGMQLQADGRLGGIFTTAGVFTFTIRIDGEGGFGISVFVIRVGQTRADTRTLPAATAGQPYAAQLQSGTLAQGDTLPPGLSLASDGKLSGTPTNAWLYRFSTLLNDAPGDSLMSTYTLEVLSP